MIVELDRVEDLEYEHKLSHLAVLARALLPDEITATEASARLSEILDSGDEDEDDHRDISLQQIRLAALSSRHHEQMWRNTSVPPYKYTIGDLGYIPEGKDFESFVVVQNVVADGLTGLDVNESAHGLQSSWEGGFRQKQDLQPFPAPLNAFGYEVFKRVSLDMSRSRIVVFDQMDSRRTS